MKLILLTAYLLAGLVTAHPTSENELRSLDPRTDQCSEKAVNNLVFKVTIDSFQKARNASYPSGCDFSSDSCSMSPDTPRGYDFTASCQRHDFAYRNMKNQGRFTKKMKKQIDKQFRHDLRTYCEGEEKLRKDFECKRIADIYYLGVRAYGKGTDKLDEVKELKDAISISRRGVGFGFEADHTGFDMNAHANHEFSQYDDDGYEQDGFLESTAKTVVKSMANAAVQDMFDKRGVGLEVDADHDGVKPEANAGDHKVSVEFDFDADIDNQEIPPIADEPVTLVNLEDLENL
ncbi:prokaryotic phospholipase A2-domain-containing protein [Aspergillus avenaceus]|uniref:Prokaryotic phospholipase A2-domain-containing protein n=1 Tax=Aspergillus avenaceus TaxID=36643 RepID=A0A5N6U321_ASPAV|nr:prokaryotic phospholipase A2-domain-containing protein [Aspergillus avenaceus]